MTNARQKHLIATASISLGISAIAVTLRFISGHYALRKVGSDDWFMLAALVAIAFFSAFVFLICENGTGRHTTEVAPGWLPTEKKLFLGFQITYNTTIYFAKMSILCFYLKFIPRDFTLRKLTWVVIFLVSTIFPIKIIVFALNCIPYSKTWNPTLHGKCINHHLFVYITATYNIFTDLAIFILPLPLLWSIRRCLKDRILIFCLFSASFTCVIISCLRLYAIRELYRGKDPLWDAAPVLIWSLLECSVGIVCGSVPVLKHLFVRKKVSETVAANLQMSRGFYQLKRRMSLSPHHPLPEGPLPDNPTTETSAEV